MLTVCTLSISLIRMFCSGGSLSVSGLWALLRGKAGIAWSAPICSAISVFIASKPYSSSTALTFASSSPLSTFLTTCQKSIPSVSLSTSTCRSCWWCLFSFVLRIFHGLFWGFTRTLFIKWKESRMGLQMLMSIKRSEILAFKVTGPTLTACVRYNFDFGQNSRKPLRLW